MYPPGGAHDTRQNIMQAISKLDKSYHPVLLPYFDNSRFYALFVFGRFYAFLFLADV